MNNILIYICVAIVLIALLAVAAEIRRELHFFKVTRYHVTSRKLSGLSGPLTILFLSDLHNWKYGEHNERLLSAIENEHPDLILIGGDMLVGKKETPCDIALDLVRKLPSLCPVYYANGNHEQRMKEETEIYGNVYEVYKRKLEESGVIFLENASQRIKIKDTDISISGLELPCSVYTKFQKAQITEQTISTMLGEPDDYCTVLLAHNPAYMDAYLKWGADIVLSGHLHGGLIRLPLIGGAVTPQGFFFPKYSGEMTREGDQTVIVSRGLGTHTINIRFLNAPELISIQLDAEPSYPL